jgi:glucuronokinase
MTRDRTVFDDIEDFRDDVARYGYYGGIRIIKASIARFLAYCRKKELSIDGDNFTLRCHTSIPAHLGLAGSSSIITAVFRALMKYYDVAIPLHEMANEIWATEIEELGISGGLQDRVAQSYQGITYMDFNETLMKTRGYGEYHPLNSESLPNLYLAYDVRAAESSDIVHNNLRYRFDQGDEDVVSAMKEFAGLADRVKEMFESGDYSGLADTINANFNLPRQSATSAAATRNWCTPPGRQEPRRSSPDPGGPLSAHLPMRRNWLL